MTHYRILGIWLLGSLAPASVLTGPAAGANLTGTVIDDNAHSIAHVWVMANQLAADPSVAATATATTQAGADGSFAFSNLPDGYYRICAQAAQSEWLNPCQWSATPPTAYITAARPVNLTVQMRRGTTVTIHVVDPSSLVTAASGLVIGVNARNGIFMPARRISQNGNSFDLQVTIPREKSVAITATSATLNLVQNDGSAIPAAGIPLKVASGAAAPVVQLRVAGAK